MNTKEETWKALTDPLYYFYNALDVAIRNEDDVEWIRVSSTRWPKACAAKVTEYKGYDLYWTNRRTRDALHNKTDNGIVCMKDEDKGSKQ